MWRSYFADKPRVSARIAAGPAAGRSVSEIQQRLLAEAARAGGAPDFGPDAPPGPLLHSAPARPLDVPAAHLMMQEHVECSVLDCPRKAAAYRVLIEAGRVVPR